MTYDESFLQSNKIFFLIEFTLLNTICLEFAVRFVNLGRDYI